MSHHAMFLWAACLPALLLVVAEGVLVCRRLRRAREAAMRQESE
jgi:hypothetical protein